MLTDNLIPIGKLSRVHGIEGKAILILEPWVNNEIKKWEWVFLNINGLPVPFFLTSFEWNSSTSAIIHLENINSIEEIQKYIGLEVLIEGKKIKKSSNTLFMEGYEVIDDQQSNLGIILHIDDFNGNIVAQVKKNDKVILIPLNEKTIRRISHRKKIIYVSLPEGLLDIY